MQLITVVIIGMMNHQYVLSLDNLDSRQDHLLNELSYQLVTVKKTSSDSINGLYRSLLNFYSTSLYDSSCYRKKV